MGDNASLDDFLGGEPSERSEATDTATSGDEAETDDTEPVDDTEPTAEVEPAQTTYAWDGAGAACDDCGEAVERRWQQAGGLVCVECKDWDRP